MRSFIVLFLYYIFCCVWGERRFLREGGELYSFAFTNYCSLCILLSAYALYPLLAK